MNRFSNVSLVHILRLFPHHPWCKSHWRIVFFLSGCSPIGISFHLNNYFWCFRNWYWWWNEYSFEDEEEMMHILFASWFKRIEDFYNWWWRMTIYLIWFKILEIVEDEEERMQILSASWFNVLETSTTYDEGHWFNSFDLKS